MRRLTDHYDIHKEIGRWVTVRHSFEMHYFCIYSTYFVILIFTVLSSIDQLQFPSVFLLQRCIFLCETSDTEVGENGVRCQICVHTSQEEGICSEGDEPALQAGPWENCLLSWCLWEEECSHYHHGTVSSFYSTTYIYSNMRSKYQP